MTDLDDIPGLSAEVAFPPLTEQATTGVYLLLFEGEVVYVGQAVDMRRRIGQHLADANKQFDGVRFLPCKLVHLDKLEARYIRAFKPRLNNCRLSNFLRDNEIEPEPLKVVEKRAPRTRKKILVAV